MQIASAIPAAEKFLLAMVAAIAVAHTSPKSDGVYSQAHSRRAYATSTPSLCTNLSPSANSWRVQRERKRYSPRGESAFHSGGEMLPVAISNRLVGHCSYCWREGKCEQLALN